MSHRSQIQTFHLIDFILDNHSVSSSFGFSQRTTSAQFPRQFDPLPSTSFANSQLSVAQGRLQAPSPTASRPVGLKRPKLTFQRSKLRDNKIYNRIAESQSRKEAAQALVPTVAVPSLGRTPKTSKLPSIETNSNQEDLLGAISSSPSVIPPTPQAFTRLPPPLPTPAPSSVQSEELDVVLDAPQNFL